MHITFLKAQDRLISSQETQNPDGTNSLTENSSQSGTFYAHSKCENEDRVEDDIDHSSDDSGQHTDFGKTLCGDKWIHAKYDQYKKTS